MRGPGECRPVTRIARDRLLHKTQPLWREAGAFEPARKLQRVEGNSGHRTKRTVSDRQCRDCGSGSLFRQADFAEPFRAHAGNFGRNDHIIIDDPLYQDDQAHRFRRAALMSSASKFGISRWTVAALKAYPGLSVSGTKRRQRATT